MKREPGLPLARAEALAAGGRLPEALSLLEQQDAARRKRYEANPDTPEFARSYAVFLTAKGGLLADNKATSACGVVLTPDRLTLTPCLPPHWRQARLHLRLAPGDGGRALAEPGSPALHQEVLLCADEATAQAALAREPLARRAQAGVPIALTGLPSGCVHVLVCAARPAPSEPPAAASSRQALLAGAAAALAWAVAA